MTGYVLYRVFELVDAPVRQLEVLFFEKHIPGLGVLTAVVLLTLLGWLGSTIIARPFKNFARKLINRAPLIGAIEGAVRDLLSALFAKERKFSHPVVVQMSGVSDLGKLGFILGGILPGKHFKDTLVLQYLNNLQIQYGKNQLHSVVSRELLEYIKNRMSHDR